MRKEIERVLNEVQLILQKVPEFVFIGNPVLRKKTKRVSLGEGQKIAYRLKRVLLRYRKLTSIGRGLAAPQVGSSGAIFVTFVNDEFQVYINPHVVQSSKKVNYYRESCLSARELWCDVKRPERVTIKWIDERGKKITKTFSGIESRLVQHEYDHLQGIVCVDRAEKGTLAYCTGDVSKEKLRKIASAASQ